MDWYQLIKENNLRNDNIPYSIVPSIKDEYLEILELKKGSIKVYRDNPKEFNEYSFIVFKSSSCKKINGTFVFNYNLGKYYFRLSKDCGSILEYIFTNLEDLKKELSYLKDIKIISEYELYRRGWGTG